jgi:hypothetical protein
MNYGATNEASIQKNQALFSSMRRPNFKTHVILERKNIWIPAGPEIKSGCAGEGHLQITGVTEADFKRRIA